MVRGHRDPVDIAGEVAGGAEISRAVLGHGHEGQQRPIAEQQHDAGDAERGGAEMRAPVRVAPGSEDRQRGGEAVAEAQAGQDAEDAEIRQAGAGKHLPRPADQDQQ